MSPVDRATAIQDDIPAKELCRLVWLEDNGGANALDRISRAAARPTGTDWQQRHAGIGFLTLAQACEHMAKAALPCTLPQCPFQRVRLGCRPGRLEHFCRRVHRLLPAENLVPATWPPSMSWLRLGRSFAAGAR